MQASQVGNSDQNNAVFFNDPLYFAHGFKRIRHMFQNLKAHQTVIRSIRDLVHVLYVAYISDTANTFLGIKGFILLHVSTDQGFKRHVTTADIQ